MSRNQTIHGMNRWELKTLPFGVFSASTMPLYYRFLARGIGNFRRKLRLVAGAEKGCRVATCRIAGDLKAFRALILVLPFRARIPPPEHAISPASATRVRTPAIDNSSSPLAAFSTASMARAFSYCTSCAMSEGCVQARCGSASPHRTQVKTCIRTQASPSADYFTTRSTRVRIFCKSVN